MAARSPPTPIIAAGPEERGRVELAARQDGEDKDEDVGGGGQRMETSPI